MASFTFVNKVTMQEKTIGILILGLVIGSCNFLPKKGNTQKSPVVSNFQKPDSIIKADTFEINNSSDTFGLDLNRKYRNTNNVIDTDQYGFLLNYGTCEKIHEYERNAVSLESLTDPYLKVILQRFYVLSEDSSDSWYSEYLRTYLPLKDSNSFLYFKVDTGLAKGYEITVTGKDFSLTKHLINTLDTTQCCLIDNQIFWGTDGDLPKEEIDKFEVKYNGKIINIPQRHYRNLYNPMRFGGLKTHGCIITDNKKSYIIFFLFGSDGAGSFVACFIFRNGKYIRRVVQSIC